MSDADPRLADRSRQLWIDWVRSSLPCLGGSGIRRRRQHGSRYPGPGLGAAARRVGARARGRSRPAARIARTRRGSPSIAWRVWDPGQAADTHEPAARSRAGRTSPDMRYQALSSACQEAGRLHLLLGHHAADQAETLAMRVLRGSQTHGLAGMAALARNRNASAASPAAGIQPGVFASFLVAHDIDWIEDPSNRDLHALRPRLRQGLLPQLCRRQRTCREPISAVGMLRAREEAQAAAELAARAAIRPEGFALLSPGPISASRSRQPGADDRRRWHYPPSPSQLSRLATRPRAGDHRRRAPDRIGRAMAC